MKVSRPDREGSLPVSNAVTTSIIQTGGRANDETNGLTNYRGMVLGQQVKDTTAMQAAANALSDEQVAASMRRLGIDDDTIARVGQDAAVAQLAAAAAQEAALRAAQYEELTRVAVPAAMSAAESALRAEQYAAAVAEAEERINAEAAIRAQQYAELTGQATEARDRAEAAALAAAESAAEAGAAAAVIDPVTGLIQESLLPPILTEAQVNAIVDSKTAIIDGGYP
jgi:hypothetical protein